MVTGEGLRKGWSVSCDKPRRDEGGGGAAWLDRLQDHLHLNIEARAQGAKRQPTTGPTQQTTKPSVEEINATWQPSWRASLFLFLGLMVVI